MTNSPADSGRAVAFEWRSYSPPRARAAAVTRSIHATKYRASSLERTGAPPTVT